ncbi:MAG TPA: DUF3352 domain-containing protein [Solirubrobacteraceae bacterium]|nr:DUF3352 domain-containing protein [Solirubrobacteraceae bacterium]
MTRAARLVLLCVLLVLLASGCGGVSAGAGADPASAVPAGTAIYLEGVLRPEGDQRDDVLDAARKLLHTDDPERRIRELVDQGLKESEGGPLSYGHDIEPWLGQRAGVWVTGAQRAKPGYVVLVATKDAQKAQQAIDGGIKRAGRRVSRRSFGDVDYQVDSDGVAAGIVGDFLTVGTEAELKRTITALDGRSLAEDKGYRRAIGELSDNRLGHFYLDVGPFVEAALRADPQARGRAGQIRALFPFDKLGPVAGAFLADGDRLALDTVMGGEGAGVIKSLGLLTGTGTTPLLAELPGDAWAAAGAPRVGRSLKGVFDRVAGALGGAVAAERLRKSTGLDLERDVFGWMGDAALFVRGSRKADLEGGLVVQSTDEALSTRAFGKFAGLARTQGGQDVQPVRVAGADAAFRIANSDLDRPIVLARGNGRVVLAYGERAAADGLKPAQRLGDADVFAQAKATLGGDYQPAFLVSMPALVAAIEQAGHPDPGYARAEPYLEALSVIAGGSRREGKKLRSRVAVGLK